MIISTELERHISWKECSTALGQPVKMLVHRMNLARRKAEQETIIVY